MKKDEQRRQRTHSWASCFTHWPGSCQVNQAAPLLLLMPLLLFPWKSLSQHKMYTHTVTAGMQCCQATCWGQWDLLLLSRCKGYGLCVLLHTWPPRPSLFASSCPSEPSKHLNQVNSLLLVAGHLLQTWSLQMQNVHKAEVCCVCFRLSAPVDSRV